MLLFGVVDCADTVVAAAVAASVVFWCYCWYC